MVGYPSLALLCDPARTQCSPKGVVFHLGNSRSLWKKLFLIFSRLRELVVFLRIYKTGQWDLLKTFTLKKNSKHFDVQFSAYVRYKRRYFGKFEQKQNKWIRNFPLWETKPIRRTRGMSIVRLSRMKNRLLSTNTESNKPMPYQKQKSSSPSEISLISAKRSFKCDL